MNRKIWSNEEKTAIVLEMIRGRDSVAFICTRHGVSDIQPTAGRNSFSPAAEPPSSISATKAAVTRFAGEARRLKELAGEQALVIEAQKMLTSILPKKMKRGNMPE